MKIISDIKNSCLDEGWIFIVRSKVYIPGMRKKEVLAKFLHEPA